MKISLARLISKIYLAGLRYGKFYLKEVKNGESY